MSNPAIDASNTNRIKLLLDELNLIIMTKVRREIKKFIHSLIDLKIVIEMIEKLDSGRESEIKKNKKHNKKALKDFKTEKTEDSKGKVRFLTLKTEILKK